MPRISEGSETHGNHEDLVNRSQRDDRLKDSPIFEGDGSGSGSKGKDRAKCKNPALAQGECSGAVGRRKVPELPEELVEQIIARMPFPSLFKASFLSRTWYFKFPVPSLNVRSASLSLQQHIASVSSRWPTFCPIFVSKDGILGFDRDANRWRSMLNLSFLPTAVSSYPVPVTCCGPLICVVSTVPDVENDVRYEVFIANVVTRHWRQLSKPSGRAHEPDHVRILPLGTDGYRVLDVLRNFPERGRIHTQVYNSKLKTWTVNEPRELGLDGIFDNSAFLDEKLYFMARDDIGDPIQLWVYDLGENSWTNVPHRVNGSAVTDGAVLRCGNRIMVAFWSVPDPGVGSGDGCSTLHTGKDVVKVFELVPRCLQLQLVAVGPPAVTWGVGPYRDVVRFSSDTDFIYFGQSFPSCPVLTFNVHTLEWSCVPPAYYTLMERRLWGELLFEPGLNPFLLV